MWNLPPPPAFQGLRDDIPLTFYERHMPHWRQAGATYFVTFRLSDSLPQSKVNQLARIKLEWERSNPAPRSNAAMEMWARQAFKWTEHWLDQSFGACELVDDSCALELINAMHHFDYERYELDCYVVMPNHAHAILRPLDESVTPLEDILGSWKSFSAKHINSLLNQDGVLWQDESHDRIIRDEEHLWRVIQYIGRNLSKAGRERDSNRLWIRPEWERLGWTFEWRKGL